jgi:hypothetical protein
VTRPDDDPFAAALLDLGLVLGPGRPLGDVLARVAEIADAALGEAPALSVTVLRDGGTTLAASADLATELDLVQYRAGRGPCLEAAQGPDPVVVADTARNLRWPELAEQAAALGRGSVVSSPFPEPGPPAAGLNVYLVPALAGDPAALAQATAFGRHAVVPVAGALLHAAAVDRARHLQTALESRAVIDQAKGILVERFRLTPQQAFDALARVSNESNTKVRDVATRLVDTGEFPPG